jgi:predicted alpha/beta superfamily hydrolase
MMFLVALALCLLSPLQIQVQVHVVTGYLIQPERAPPSSVSVSRPRGGPLFAATKQQQQQQKQKQNGDAVPPPPSLPPRRTLEPPFPNGPCGGTVISIPPEETFGIDVNLAQINFGGSLILPPRTLKVWLPPTYATGSQSQSQSQSNSRHPTLYVHDGQNSMEDADSWTGTSWRLAGALTRMADHGLLATELPIVVMIPSMDGDFLPGLIRRRHLEYGDSNFPFAQAHVDFVAKTVKPLVDARFRTNPNPSHTFCIGSSLGGQASLHLLLRYPHLFGGAACLSPAFGPNLTQEVARSSSKSSSSSSTRRGSSGSGSGGSPLQSKRIYLDIGGDLNDVTVPWVDVLDHLTSEHWWNPGYFWLDTALQSGVESMKRALEQAGVNMDEDVCFEEFPGGRHNERAWAQRVHVPLLHLFGHKNNNTDDSDERATSMTNN